MDLMTGSASYSDLKKKYRNFSAPTIRITVDGTEIVQKLNAGFSAVTVELTSEFSASGCSFDVLNEYSAKNTDFLADGSAKLLQLGAKVELELGYIETTVVFSGLIAEVEYILDNISSPYIHVECMDAKCLLMKQQKLALFSEQSITDTISEMLDTQPFSDYASIKTIDALSNKLDMIPTVMNNDYQFVVQYAQYIGYEFFIIQGDVYLRKVPQSVSPIMTLSPGEGILSFKMSLRGTSLYKKAVVTGINPEDDKEVTGESPISGKFGNGSRASQMMGESVKTYFDRTVKSAAEAASRAKTLIQSAKSGFGRIECRCVGLPELVPGRSVKIKGISKDADVECYIINVRHELDERGFFTTLEARIEEL